MESEMNESTNSEPTRFAWFRDGDLVAGTLEQWAKMWEGDYYAGDGDLSRRLLTWDGTEQGAQFHLVEVDEGALTEDEFMTYGMTVPGLPDVASVTIDRRH